MNKEQLEIIIRNYIDKFDYVNNEEHSEYYKWIAVRHFQANWDIDAKDFGEMFKEALGKSENLINNRIVQPSNGISFLCKEENGYMEEVRSEFKKLIANDNGDYDQRLGKIDSFIHNINAMLQKVAPGKWKYDQDKRSVIMYLSFIDPESNYMFKATCAKEFADCIEFGDDIGSGQTFSLKNYYRLCDELMNELHNHTELLGLLDEMLAEHEDNNGSYDKKLKDIDPSLHILVYDLMYCASTYELYDGMTIKKKSKASSMAQRREERKQQIEQLWNKIEEINEELEKTSAEIEGIGIPDCMGMTLKNIKYGQGEVKKQVGRYLTVQFGVDERKFAIPDAIAKGFLKTDVVEIVEKCKVLASLLEQQEKQVKEIRYINAQLEII
ncbi:hypothetical protein [Anaerosporobacter sp.]